MKNVHFLVGAFFAEVADVRQRFYRALGFRQAYTRLSGVTTCSKQNPWQVISVTVCVPQSQIKLFGFDTDFRSEDRTYIRRKSLPKIKVRSMQNKH